MTYVILSVSEGSKYIGESIRLLFNSFSKMNNKLRLNIIIKAFYRTISNYNYCPNIHRLT